MTEFQKAVRSVLANQNLVHPDKVVYKRDGSVGVFRSYFYTFSQTAEGWAKDIGDILTRNLPSLPAGGFTVTSQDSWKPWPKQSYFIAIVRPGDGKRKTL